MMNLTLNDQQRLAMIRAGLEKHRAMGIDVSGWEAEFFFRIIEQIRESQGDLR